MLTTSPRRPAVRLPSVRIAAAAPAVVPMVAITAVGLVLRAWAFGRVGGNPFYDAAVRSMGLSWHDFFFGASEPGGRVAIDKAPADLWIQVLSVKLLGFSGTAVRPPELLAGTLAIPLLYDLVRRLFGRPAGLGAAATPALLPTAILTAHSDTMDSVMMHGRTTVSLGRARSARSTTSGTRTVIGRSAASKPASSSEICWAMVGLLR
jgi:4-amino-4-deoxy-L-arabinose transferase-like glycosyltransferase